MRDQELVNALRTHLEVTRKIGLYPGKSGIWAVIEQATDRIANQSTNVAALQQEIEKLRGDLKLHRCATCDFWRENDPRCMNGQSQWGGKTVPKDNYCRYWEHHTDWIPVTERLPEVWCNDKTAELVNYMIYSPDFGVDIGSYHAKAKKWLCMALPCTVTHWMPLPEPPEVK